MKSPTDCRSEEPSAAASVLRSLNKPVLFALCGAVGGVAALLIGELAWFLAKPNVVQNPPNLRISVPDSVESYSGGKQRFKARVARDHWNGPVELEIFDAPAGISAPPPAVPEGAAEADAQVEIVVDAGVAAGRYPLPAARPSASYHGKRRSQAKALVSWLVPRLTCPRFHLRS